MRHQMLYVGVMSGTSLDGADAVLLDLSGQACRMLGATFSPYDDALRTSLLALQQSGVNELHEAAVLSNRLAQIYAHTIQRLLVEAEVSPEKVAAIGCHGQTVRHCPSAGYTVQLCNGAALAELTGITVVCDFRSRDIAAGGEGAPLVPAFHHAMFADRNTHRVIVNIGGIANITDLPPNGQVRGFDTGPGNMLMDGWTLRHLGRPFDDRGEWALSGKPIQGLLRALQNHEFFRRQPPKSTGRDLFNLDWLDLHLRGDENPRDVQATLLALAVATIAESINTYCAEAGEIYLCGGGARNVALVTHLAASLPDKRISSTLELGIAVGHVEACAFAWLAQRALAGEPGNLPSVTGARGPRILGAAYPR